MTNFTNNDLVITLVILAVCAVLYYLPKTAFWTKHIIADFEGDDPCFMCNKGTCVACPTYNPHTMIVNQAYVVRKVDGKVTATGTLTYKEDFCVAQSPGGGNQAWEIPACVGTYKTAIMKWVDSEHKLAGEERSVTFS